MALTYNVHITGDCTNSNIGVIELFPLSGVSPYTVDWYSPNLLTDLGIITSSSRSGLSAGTYSVLITDSTMPQNQTLYVNLTVSSGVCTSLVSVVDTTCGVDNGTVTVSATTAYSPIKFYLYGYSATTDYYITSATTYSSLQTFYGLSAGTYYIVAEDGGGCTGETGTFIIKASSPLDFGLFTLNNSQCVGISNGSIYVTGLTGNPPYTYTWSSGQITQNISGLTNGPYAVTVTDSSGCSLTKSATITTASLLSIVNFVNVTPNCFTNDGEITVTLSGGTPPFYYQLSTGQNDVLFSNIITYTGLPAGTYSVIVTDGALCVTSGSTVIATPGAFTNISVSKTNSICTTTGGIINVTATGGYTSITFSLTDSMMNTTTIIGGPSASFTGLSTGFYTLYVTNGSSCDYTEIIEIINEVPFNLSAETSGTTCGLDNGSVTISVDTPGLYTYQLGGQIFANTALQSVQFTNLASGYYTVSVSDANPESLPCVQTITFVIEASTGLKFSLNASSCVSGAEGTITAIITEGTPPFTYNWTPNVLPQTGIYITGLTAGTYTLQITDANGCVSTKSTTISCSQNNVTYELFTICDSTFVENYGAKLGLLQMLNNGYQELISGETGCVFSKADFTISIVSSGNTYVTSLNRTYSLLEVPSDEEYVTAITNLLYTIPGINGIVVNAQTNTIELSTDCDKLLEDTNITISLQIDYIICCNLLL